MSKLLMVNMSAPANQVWNITEQILTYYLGTERELTENNLKRCIQMISDRIFIHGYYQASKLHALAGHEDIYRYNYAYRGLVADTTITTLKNFGTAHGDELNIIFKHPGDIFPRPSHDEEVRQFALTCLTNFAKYGTPTPDNKTGNYLVDELKWLPIVNDSQDFSHMRYLNIGQVVVYPENVGYLNFGLGPVKLNMGEDLFQERMEFWDSLPLAENNISKFTNLQDYSDDISQIFDILTQ